MKHWIIITIILITYSQSFGQEHHNGFFFDELAISINRSTLKDENTIDKFGFGIGVYHTSLRNKSTNIKFGFEYNRTNQFKNKISEGHFAHITDVTYSLNNLSIPINILYNFGSDMKIFIETGVFLDMIISSYRKGTMHTGLPDENNHIVYTEFEINEKASLSSINYGFAFGFGAVIPFDKFELIVKPDYRLGLKELSSSYDNFTNSYLRLNIALRKKN